MTDKVLVTGGAGFVGSHVADAYLEAGCEVTVLDDLSTGRRERVPTAARFVQADVRSPEARQLLATGGVTPLNHHAAQMDVRRSLAAPVLDRSEEHTSELPSQSKILCPLLLLKKKKIN